MIWFVLLFVCVLVVLLFVVGVRHCCFLAAEVDCPLSAGVCDIKEVEMLDLFEIWLWQQKVTKNDKFGLWCLPPHPPHPNLAKCPKALCKIGMRGVGGFSY